MRSSYLVGAALVVIGAAIPASASVPAPTKEQLEAEAQVIVTGKADAVYSADEDPGDGFAYVHYCVALVVDKVEKGEGPKPGELLFIRCRQTVKRPKDYIDDSQQDTVPQPGGHVRAYLFRSTKDGGYRPLRDGIQLLDGKPAAKPVAASGSSAGWLQGWWWLPVGILVG